MGIIILKFKVGPPSVRKGIFGIALQPLALPPENGELDLKRSEHPLMC